MAVTHYLTTHLRCAWPMISTAGDRLREVCCFIGGSLTHNTCTNYEVFFRYFLTYTLLLVPLYLIRCFTLLHAHSCARYGSFLTTSY